MLTRLSRPVQRLSGASASGIMHSANSAFQRREIGTFNKHIVANGNVAVMNTYNDSLSGKYGSSPSSSSYYEALSTDEVLDEHPSQQSVEYRLIIAVSPTRFDEEALKTVKSADSARFWYDGTNIPGHVAAGIFKLEQEAADFGLGASVVPDSIISFRPESSLDETDRRSIDELRQNIAVDLDDEVSIKRAGTASMIISITLKPNEVDIITKNIKKFEAFLLEQKALHPEKPVYELMDRACGHAFYYAMMGVMPPPTGVGPKKNAISPQTAVSFALQKFFEERPKEEKKAIQEAFQSIGLAIQGNDLSSPYPQPPERAMSQSQQLFGGGASKVIADNADEKEEDDNFKP